MMSKWSDDSACLVVHDVLLYSVLHTVAVSTLILHFGLILFFLHFLQNTYFFVLVSYELF